MKPGEHKTVQARILEYAEAIGWTFVPREEAERRRGFDPEVAPADRAKNRSLFFDDLLDSRVREFNPRYAEAEGALLGQFRHLHTDIYGNREFVEHLRNRGKFLDHEEKRERDLILIDYGDASSLPNKRRNVYEVTEEWAFHNGHYGTREDVVFLINGIPVLVIECKNASKDEAIALGVDQIRRYHRDTTSGTGADERVHVLVKPVRPDLTTNLVIHTNRRSYHLELAATPDTWIAAVAWRYPLDRLAMLKTSTANAEAVAPVATGVALERLNFRYSISGDSPAWRPLRAFDDGEKVYIQFPPGVSDLPPLFTVGPKGQVELVNYRSRAPYYLVDRLFEAAELRLGADSQQTVRISRLPAAERRR